MSKSLSVLFENLSYRQTGVCALLILLSGCGDGQKTNRENPVVVSPLAKTSRVLANMVEIPAGVFIMGSNKKDEPDKQKEYGLIDPLYLDENPQHEVNLPAYFIDQYEVTNAQYKQFVARTSHKEPFGWTQNGYNLLPVRLAATDLDSLRWVASEYFKLDVDTQTADKNTLLTLMAQDQALRDTLPVTGVSWLDAFAYCRWAGKRLPGEAEWEKAARGAKGLEYPWGESWDAEKTNTGDNDWDQGIAPVGSYPANRSPYGVFDLPGNVWEWTADWYKPYPGSDYQHKAFGETNRVIRGGGGGLGHYALSVFYRGAARSYAKPDMASDDVGFRCAKDS